MDDGLVGQHVWFTQDARQQIGRITLAVGRDHFLVRMITDGLPQYNEVVTLSDLADAFLFDSRGELDKFRAWCAEDRPALKLVRSADDSGWRVEAKINAGWLKALRKVSPKRRVPRWYDGLETFVGHFATIEPDISTYLRTAEARARIAD